jgi:hypothetical protein
MTTLDLDSTLKGLPLLLLSRDSLLAHNTTAPMSSVLLMLVIVAFLDRADQLRQLALVL